MQHVHASVMVHLVREELWKEGELSQIAISDHDAAIQVYVHAQ